MTTSSSSKAPKNTISRISTISIPRETLTVITGLSGSGKSSLAFDTIFAEGQRRYVESLSTYARQFLETLDKPDVESIDGLSRRFQFSRKPPRTTRALPSVRSPRCTITCACSSRALRDPFATRAANPFHADRAADRRSHSRAARRHQDQHFRAHRSRQKRRVRQRAGRHAPERLRTSTHRRRGARPQRKTSRSTSSEARHRCLRRSLDICPAPAGTKGFDPMRGRLQESVETALKFAEGLVKVDKPTAKAPTPRYFIPRSSPAWTAAYLIPRPSPAPFRSTPHGRMSPIATASAISLSMTRLTKRPIRRSAKRPPSISGRHAKNAMGQGGNLSLCSLRFPEKHLRAFLRFSVTRLAEFFSKIEFSKRELLISDRVLKEIRDRLQFLLHVGVGYISLDRPAQTLSGGESQRIRLATQIGSSLVGVKI